MPKVIGWRAWYSGGRTFDSATTPWTDLPTEGVIGFMLYEDTLCPDGVCPTRRQLANADWYWLDRDGFHKSATSLNREEWVPAPLVERNTLKGGEWVEDGEYDRAVAAMTAARRAP